MHHDRVELPGDCRTCGLQGAAVEVYDGSSEVCAQGVPLEVSCPLCGASDRGEVHPDGVRRVRHTSPIDLTDRAALERALAAWAEREGHATTHDLLQATFVEPSVDAILRRVAQGQPIETLADPFGVRGVVSAAPPTALAAVTSVPDAPSDPRSIVWPLVSVMMADGRIAAEERVFVDDFLAQEGLDPLRDIECRILAPQAVAPHIPPERRPELVERMCALAYVDGRADPTELRVLRAYARAWLVSDLLVQDWLEEYERSNTTWVSRWWRRRTG